MTVTDVQEEDEGVYTCEVITKLDMAEASGSITLVGKDYTCLKSWAGQQSHLMQCIKGAVCRIEWHLAMELQIATN